MAALKRTPNACREGKGNGRFSSTRLLSGCAGERSTLNRTDEDEGIDGIDGDIDGGLVDGREGERGHSTR